MRSSRQILNGFMYLARFAQRQGRPIFVLFPSPIPQQWMVIWRISVNSFLPMNMYWWCWIVRDGIVQRPFVLPRIWPYFCYRRIVRNWIRWSCFGGRCVTSILGIKCSRRLNSWIRRWLMLGVMLLAIPKPSAPCAFFLGLSRQSITKIGIIFDFCGHNESFGDMFFLKTGPNTNQKILWPSSKVLMPNTYSVAC